ncbi:RhiA [Pectobacterium cacticida]|uniref:RhiA n=1 Tax=Pectobacterium cacticida TaxID=69221 RepID=A0ABZ2GBB1_9GAMM|nr:RhiA [Pectobacterium cacticida]UYX06746.1 RhiA [Pectobacterium cacticida]
MANQYSVEFINHSSNSGNVAIFQKAPDQKARNIFSLAWFSKFVNPNVHETFRWNIDYSFVWSDTGEVKPGVIFEGGEEIPANLQSANTITLDYNGGYFFGPTSFTGQAGSLYIDESGNVPLKQAAVGIGMSNAGTFVQAAQPNLHIEFIPHPSYWIVFGNYEEGEILDIEQISDAVELVFEPNIYDVVATLQQNNTWTIS